MRTIRHVSAVLLFLGLASAFSPVVLAQANTAERVTSLADRYVEQVRQKFPLIYAGSGLPAPKRDTLDINAPADLTAWREFLSSLERDIAAIDAASIADRPEWITLALLRQAIIQDRAIQTCRAELWTVQGYGWQAYLAQVAELQPVGDAANRAAILARFGHVPEFAAQEIANLRAGQRLGFSATRTAVNSVLEQLDALLAEPLAKSSYASPAERDTDEAFQRAWGAMLVTQLRPALIRYRNFLRSEYLPRARATASIKANKNGEACYRARVTANSSVDVAPKALYSRAAALVDKEGSEVLQAGRRRYGREFPSLAVLAEAVRADPKNHFSSAENVREFIVLTMAHGKAAAGRIVPQPPKADVEPKAFPESSNDSAPSGQYVPGDAEGSRPPIYYYRADYRNLAPSQLEATVLHETWPGHHLQMEVTRAHAKSGSHPLAQLVFVPGVGEGWATYVESLGRELSLYDSELGNIGSVMNSMTPRLVADIGMHVLGWDEKRTLEYLVSKFPATPLERVRMTVDAIVEDPGVMVPYALGAMEIEALRGLAERGYGKRFDLREFHQIILEDGTVPFPALRAKLERRIGTTADTKAGS